LKNTNCYFFQDADFEIFYAVRELIIHQDTDDIFNDLEYFFATRLEVSFEFAEHEEITILN